MHYEKLFTNHRSTLPLIANCIAISVVQELVELSPEKQATFLNEVMVICIVILRQATSVIRKWSTNGDDPEELLQGFISTMHLLTDVVSLSCNKRILCGDLNGDNWDLCMCCSGAAMD